MALRSVLDIEVNDSAFRDYKRSFDDYAKLVKGLPNDFAKSWALLQKQRGAFNEMVAAMVSRKYLEQQRAAAQKEADRLTRSQADYWRSIAKSSKEFAGHIASTTLSLAKWAGPLSIVTGLLGAAGGLFGLDRLAGGVSAQRRGAMGLGIRYGQGRAFGLDFGRFVDANSLLGNVSGALYDATSPGYTGLLAAGIKQPFLQSHNAAEVSQELLHRLPGLFAGTPREFVGAKAHALGIDQLLSGEDIVRYLNASPAERRAQEQAYGRDASALGLDPKAQRAWQDFMTAMDRAGQGIETTFVRGLAPLTEPLSKLSAAFEHAAEAFLGSDAVKGAIEGITKGLEQFASYVGTPQFQEDLRSFVDGISFAAKKIVSALRFFGLLPDAKAELPEAQIAPPGEYREKLARNPLGTGTGTHDVQADTSPGRNFWWQSGGKPNFPAIGTSPVIGQNGAPSLADRERFIRSYAASIGIDPDVAAGVARREGLGGQVGDYGTSFGDFQLHYAPNGRAVGDRYTAATGHHASDQSNWQEQDRFALDWARTHGWGDWSSMRGHNPYEGIGTQPTVRIDNATGANTIITTNAAVNN